MRRCRRSRTRRPPERSVVDAFPRTFRHPRLRCPCAGARGHTRGDGLTAASGGFERSRGAHRSTARRTGRRMTSALMGNAGASQPTSGGEPIAQSQARAFVVAFHAAVRAVRLYPVENTAVQKALQELAVHAERVMKADSG